MNQRCKVPNILVKIRVSKFMTLIMFSKFLTYSKTQESYVLLSEVAKNLIFYWACVWQQAQVCFDLQPQNLGNMHKRPRSATSYSFLYCTYFIQGKFHRHTTVNVISYCILPSVMVVCSYNAGIKLYSCRYRNVNK